MKKVFSLAGALMLAAMSAAAQTPAQQPSTQKPVTFGQPQQGAPAQAPPREMTHPVPFQPKASGPLAQIQGFNVVLVVGETQPASNTPSDDPPPAAKKALADMRDFLPFKHYRVVDSQWTSCCSESFSQTLRGRLQGVFPYAADRDAQVMASYVLQVSSGTKLNVKFTLNHDAARGSNLSSRHEDAEKRLADLRVHQQILEDEAHRLLQQRGEKHPDVAKVRAEQQRVQQRIAESTNAVAVSSGQVRQLDASATLVDGSFAMDPGETVVVGTSRFGGDKALIAIVTAVRRGTR